MSTVGTILRHAREERGLSIEDIADATRINRKTLEDIENDIPLRLPITYVKAFLKSYAQHVGVDPAEVLDTFRQESAASSEHPKDQALTPLLESTTKETTVYGKIKHKGNHHTRSLIVFIGIVAVGLVVSLIWLQRGHDAESVQEIPFSEMMKEQDGKQHGVQSLSDTTQKVSALTPRQSMVDSLLLEGVAVESTWIHLSIDSAAARDYSVPPQYRMKWKAARSYLLTVGNGGGMFFTLNNVRLGTFGQTNKPVKDILLTRETLEKPSRQGKKK